MRFLDKTRFRTQRLRSGHSRQFKSRKKNRRRRLARGIEPLEARWMLAGDWHNPYNGPDVNDDLEITAFDMGLIVSRIVNAEGPHTLPGRLQLEPPFVDTNDDGDVAPSDLAVTVAAILDVDPRVLLRPASDSDFDGTISEAEIIGLAANSPADARLFVGVDGMSRNEFVALPVTAVDEVFTITDDFLDGLAGDSLANGNHSVSVELRSDGGQELFLASIEFDLQRSGLAVRQVTDTLKNAFLPATHGTSDDGNRIAYITAHDVTGNNTDGNEELFLYDASSGQTTQLTDTSGFVAHYSQVSPNGAQPALDGDGSRVSFLSTGDFTGTNADRNPEIFLLEIASGQFTQITQTVGSHIFNGWIDISGDATRIAFVSNADLTGTNPDESFEIFTFNSSTQTLVQLTDSGTDDSSAISRLTLSGDGTSVAFKSKLDLAASNADGSTEIFLADTATGQMRQVTDTTEFGIQTGLSNGFGFSDNGDRIAFHSSQDLTGDNAEGRTEIFLYDVSDNQLTQVTDDTLSFPFSFEIKLNGDGTLMTFTANTSTGPEVFLLALGGLVVTQLTDDSSQASNTVTALSDTGATVTLLSNLATASNTDGTTEIHLLDVATRQQTQVTELPLGVGHFGDAAISGDGSTIAFTSDGDLTGNNADRNEELFVYNVVTGELTQVTDTNVATFNVTGPSLDDSGARIAFTYSGVDLANSGQTTGLWLYDRTTDQFQAIDAGFPGQPVLSSDGDALAFTSTSDHTGENGDGSREVFVYTVSTNEYTQVTESSSGLASYFDLTLSGDGSRVVFTSSGNFTGGNTDGNVEVFFADVASANVAQVTDTQNPNSDVVSMFLGTSISEDGQRIVFDSIADLTGENPDGERQIYLYNIPNSALTQVTIGSKSGGAFLSSDGSRILVHSTGDFTGQNPDASPELFVYTVASGTFEQVTDTIVTSIPGSLTISPTGVSDDLKSLTFSSFSDFTGNNPDGNLEIFLAMLN